MARSIFPNVRHNGQIIASAFFALSVVLSGIAQSADNPQVGKAASVVNFVIGDNLSKLRQLSAEDPVFALERISAELDSHGEILLNDNTKIVVGPGAEISLDDFVVAGNNIQSGTISVLKGAFRFISGEAPKGTFKVVTPLSTIGIRGTLFDVYVNDRGQTDVIIYSGRVNVCTLNNKCRDLHETCDIVRVSSKSRIKAKRFLRSGNKTIENKRYSLIANQNRFPAGWQAPIDSCDARGNKAFNRNNIEENWGGNDEPSAAPDPGATDPGITGVTGPSVTF